MFMRQKGVKLEDMKDILLRKNSVRIEYFFQVKRIAHASFWYVRLSRTYF